MDEKAAVTYPIAKDEEDRWVEIKDARAGDKYSCPECRSLDRQFGRLFSQMKHMKIATGDPILPEWWSAAVVWKEL